MNPSASSADTLIVLGVLVAAFGFALFMARFEPRARARRKAASGFAKAKAVKAVDAAAGAYVAVEGKVGPAGPLVKGRLSGRRGVWARTEAREIRTRGLWTPSTGWVSGRRHELVAKEVVCSAFVLDDGSGERILVNPEGAAEVVVDDDEFSEIGTIDASTKREAKFLLEHGVQPESFLGVAKQFSLQEQVIPTKSTIRVAGVIQRVSATPETHGCALMMSADAGDLFLANMSDAALTKPSRSDLLGRALLASGLVALAVGGVMAYFHGP